MGTMFLIDVLVLILKLMHIDPTLKTHLILILKLMRISFNFFKALDLTNSGDFGERLAEPLPGPLGLTRSGNPNQKCK